MKIIDPILSGSVNSSGSLTIPRGRANQKPSSPKTGSIFLEISDSGSNLVVYNGSGSTGWQTVGQQGTPAAPPASADIEYLVVAGGGSGGSDYGGGGGAGGYLSSSLSSVESGSSFTVTVGSGGSSVTGGNNDGNNGNDSTIAGTTITTITAVGGGGGGAEGNLNGKDGGSGGGGAFSGATAGTGGSGTFGQGNDGGDGQGSGGLYLEGGGGGAGTAGEDAVANTSNGDGGDGLASKITGTSVTRAGGGGAGYSSDYNKAGASGGTGGGGAGGTTREGHGTSGTTNTGAGGGGAGGYNTTANSGAGGSGVAIFAYDSGSINGAGGIVGDAGNGRKYNQFNTSDTFKVGSSTDFQIVSDNLLLHFDAGDFRSRGASTITDISTNTNNGTVSGATLGQNWWYDFDGSNDYITAPPTSYVSSGYSIEFWIYKDAINTSYDCIYAAGYGLQIYWRNDDIELYIATTDGGSYVVNGTAITGLSATTWVHAVITDDGSGNVVMYEDGTQSTTATYSGTPYVYTGTPRIGDYAPSAGSYPLDGRISQFRIYSDALSAAEVLQNYNATKTNFV